jgi:hypothetical protein
MPSLGMAGPPPSVEAGVMAIAFPAVFRKYLTGMIPLAILEHSNLDPLYEGRCL